MREPRKLCETEMLRRMRNSALIWKHAKKMKEDNFNDNATPGCFAGSKRIVLNLTLQKHGRLNKNQVQILETI